MAQRRCSSTCCRLSSLEKTLEKASKKMHGHLLRHHDHGKVDDTVKQVHALLAKVKDVC